MSQEIASQLNKNIKDHIKEVMTMALKAQQAKLTVPKSLLRLYMLELKLMGVQVTSEEGKEHELYIKWDQQSIKKELDRRGGSERLLRGALRLSESTGKSNK